MFNFTQTYNATTDSNTVVCLYPMSGGYEVMQRALYYGFLVFAFAARAQPWLVTGAVASALTYSGTAAIHSMVLAGVSRNSLPDLDMFGVWALASAGCMIMLPAAEFSKQLRESPARPVFKFWGFLMMIGSVMSAVALLRKYPEEEACMSITGTLLTRPHQWNASTFNCTYACFSTRQLMRSPSEIVVVTKQSLLAGRSNLLLEVLLLNYLFAFYGYGCLFATGRRRTKAEINEDLRDTEAQIASPARDTALVGPDGVYLPSLSYKKLRIEQELETGEYQLQPFIGFWCILSPPLFVVVVVLNEIIIPQSNALAFKEPVYAVGQWSGYVGTILAILASLITQRYLPRYTERQEILAKEDKERKEERERQAQEQQSGTTNDV